MTDKIYNIHIIDDCNITINLMKNIVHKLSPLKATTTIYDSGYKFLDNLDLNLVDLILLDYNMPILNGAEVVEELNQMTKPIPPVIFITGNQFLDPKIMEDYTFIKLIITKPFDISTLAVNIKSILKCYE